MKFDKFTLKHLKEQIVNEKRQELLFDKYKVSESLLVINLLHDHIDCLQKGIYVLRKKMKQKKHPSKIIYEVKAIQRTQIRI